MAYATFEDLKKGIIAEYPKNTTDERFKRGLNRVARPGFEANPDTAELYDERTNGDAAEKLVERWSMSRLFRRK